ncbi:MAG: biotin transporter BioY [Eggerthellaceae bacterium]|nr:biotin transporter BioY [Eggerthellaceae bacterium]
MPPGKGSPVERTSLDVTVTASNPSRTRSIAFVGLTIAIMAVSAWVTIPLGPVPFTLQMFAVTFAIVVLTPGQAMAAIAGYLLLGAVGVPVFSGMRGGIGVLAGPTGGFLWGYLFGVAAAVALLWLVRTRLGWGAKVVGRGVDPAAKALMTPGQRVLRFARQSGVEVLAGVLFTAIAYACGCVQYAAVAGVSVEAAFLVACAPFIVVDLCKIVAAVVCAQAVRAAVR